MLLRVPLSTWSLRAAPVIEGRQLYRLLSAPFIHADLAHLVNNMLWVLRSGYVLEARRGCWRYLLEALGIAVCAGVMNVGASILQVCRSQTFYLCLGESVVLFLRRLQTHCTVFFGLCEYLELFPRLFYSQGRSHSCLIPIFSLQFRLSGDRAAYYKKRRSHYFLAPIFCFQFRLLGDRAAYYKKCLVGFSSASFALRVISQHENAQDRAIIFPGELNHLRAEVHTLPSSSPLPILISCSFLRILFRCLLHLSFLSPDLCPILPCVLLPPSLPHPLQSPFLPPPAAVQKKMYTNVLFLKTFPALPSLCVWWMDAGLGGQLKQFTCWAEVAVTHILNPR